MIASLTFLISIVVWMW